MLRNSNDKLVSKPWGEEKWLADGSHTPYALKRILFLANNRSSLQVHQKKYETNYVLDGFGTFLISRSPIDIQMWIEGKNKEAMLSKVMKDLMEIELKPEVVIDVPPGFVHRVIALTDLTFIECSTTELDDVLRLQDDNARGDGRLDSEHKKP